MLAVLFLAYPRVLKRFGRRWAPERYGLGREARRSYLVSSACDNALAKTKHDKEKERRREREIEGYGMGVRTVTILDLASVGDISKAISSTAHAGQDHVFQWF